MLWKSLFFYFSLCLVVLPSSGLAQSYLSSGQINSSSGVPDRDLKYEDFRITEDGFVTGSIVNVSDRARQGIRLDMWTTNMQETKILWRKSLDVGTLGPHAKYAVKEPYNVENENPARTKFMFRLPSGSNFRNK